MAKAKTTKKAASTTAKATARATPKKRVTQRGDKAPEAKATTKEQSAAAEKLFKDADEAARAGLPPDMTVEQRENQVRLAALGR